jgi:hypothetical protein
MVQLKTVSVKKSFQARQMHNWWYGQRNSALN